MNRKTGEIVVPTEPVSRATKITGFTFKSYDKSAGVLQFQIKNQDGSPTDLIDATVRLFMYIYQGEEKKEFPIFDNQIITESYMQGIVKYRIPDMLLSYEGKVDANVYIDFLDGSHTDNLAFTFNIEKSIIDGDVQLNGEYYFKDFQQLLDGVKQEATDAVNEVLVKVEASSTKMQELEQRIDEQTEIFNNADVYNKAEIEEKLEPFALRTDIDTLETKKADVTWIKSTFATAQTQFMSTFYTLQDLKNAYPTGTKGTYLVIDNNSLYVYENGNWVNKGRYEASVDVKDGAVNWRKTNFLNVGKNKLNPDAIQTGGYFKPDTGAWVTGADYAATEEIPVAAGETWTVNLCRFVAFYNAQGQVVTPGVDDPSIGRNTFTIPATAVNMRVSFLTQRLDAVQIERGSEPTIYEPFGYLFEKAMLSRKNIRDFKILSDQDVENDALSGQSVNFVQTRKNKFNPATVVNGYYNHPDSGVPVPSESYQFNIISIPKDAKKVAINKCRFLTFFNGDKYLSGITNADDIKTVADIPQGATKLATSNRIIEMDTIQVEFNEDTTSYEPYMEILEGVKVRGTDVLGEADSVEVAVPKTIYGTIGEEMQIYTKNFLPTIEKKFEVDYNGKYALQNEDGLLINPTESVVSPITLEIFSNYLSVFRDDLALSVKPMRSSKLTGLVFGDSTINATYETQRMLDKLGTNLELLGTRGTGANKHEGRGGWTFATYRTATEYQGTVNPFFDPSKGDFSFAYYAAQQQMPKLDFLFIQLGINDTFNFFSDVELKTAIEKILADANYIIDDILAFDASIKLGLAITFPPNDSQNIFGTAYGTSQNQWRYKRNNHIWQKTLIDTFANDSRVTLVPLSAVIDTAKNIADGVHPTVNGYNQLGDQVVAWLNHI